MTYQQAERLLIELNNISSGLGWIFAALLFLLLFKNMSGK